MTLTKISSFPQPRMNFKAYFEPLKFRTTIDQSRSVVHSIDQLINQSIRPINRSFIFAFLWFSIIQSNNEGKQKANLIYSHVFFTFYGYITNSQSDQLLVDLAQLVEHCTCIAEVMDSNPV